MVKILSDTSTLYSIVEGAKRGIAISPLSVTIRDKTYREFEEISSKEFLDIIDQGYIPTSSQPAFGEVLASYDAYDDDIINIAMADGLSGTYESAVSAAKQSRNRERITVVNSKTLCGPHRYMVEQAVQLASEGEGKEKILSVLDELIASTKSFLIPFDFGFLKRGGRLTPLAANMMGLLKAIPVLVQSEDGKKLEPHFVHRREKPLISDLVRSLQKHGVGSGWLISVSHAANSKRAETIRDAFRESFPETRIEILPLSPSFITQGGPKCVAIQAVRLYS